MRLVFRRTHPELEAHQWNDEIDQLEVKQVKAEGFELAASLYYALPLQEFTRELDGFSDDNIAPIVNFKYQEK
jgi:hypothetical protein